MRLHSERVKFLATITLSLVLLGVALLVPGASERGLLAAGEPGEGLATPRNTLYVSSTASWDSDGQVIDDVPRVHGRSRDQGKWGPDMPIPDEALGSCYTVEQVTITSTEHCLADLVKREAYRGVVAAESLEAWLVGFRKHMLGVGGEVDSEVDDDSWIIDLVVTDLDGDGDLDVVTGEYDGRITAWENNGMPFGASWTAHEIDGAPNWNRLLALGAGDFDGDEDVDLVSGYYRNNYGPVIWENDGSPFEGDWEGTRIGSHKVGAIALGDMDSDGRLDIVTGGGRAWGDPPSEENRVTVFHNPMDPFNDTWQITDVGLVTYSVRAIDVGDVDGDGDNDIVIGASHAPAVGTAEDPVPRDQWIDAYQVRSFRNDGDAWPAFDVGRDPKTETLPFIEGLGLYHGFWGASVTDVVLLDLDDDGDLDIVATQEIEGDFQVTAWQNDGTPYDGQLWSPSAISKGDVHNWLRDDVWWVAPGDYDQDGDFDLVVGSGPGESHQVMVWENTGTAFGTVISDTAWVRRNVGQFDEQTRAGGVADFDRDGDLDLVASEWVSRLGEIVLWENYPLGKILLPLVIRSTP
jgi:hypothetical protein